MIFPQTPIETIEFIVMIAFLIMGISHMVQPAMWVDYFSSLYDEGSKGVVTSIVALQLWPALLIVALHQVWSGPGLILTLYGWLLLVKCTIALLVPSWGLRGLNMADRHNKRGFIIAGIMLLCISASCAWALYL